MVNFSLPFSKEKANELNRDEFMKFWSDVYALFDRGEQFSNVQ